MAKTHKQIIAEIAQEGGIPPDGYTFAPYHDPPLIKTDRLDDEPEVDRETPNVVDTGDTEEAGDDGDAAKE